MVLQTWNLSQQSLTGRGVRHIEKTVQSLYFLSWTTVPLPQNSLFHTPHVMWLAARQALGNGAQTVVWNSIFLKTSTTSDNDSVVPQ